jgi:hypothetical protein
MCRVLGEMAPGHSRDTLVARVEDWFMELSSELAHGGVVHAGVLARAAGAADSIADMALSPDGRGGTALWQQGALILEICHLARLASLPRGAPGSDGPAGVAARTVGALAACAPALPALDEAAFVAGAALVAAARAASSPSSLHGQPLSQWLYPELLSTALACLQPPAPELPDAWCSSVGRRRTAHGRVRLQRAAAELLTACASRGPEYARALQAAVALAPSSGDAPIVAALQRFRDSSGAGN